MSISQMSSIKKWYSGLGVILLIFLFGWLIFSQPRTPRLPEVEQSSFRTLLEEDIPDHYLLAYHNFREQLGIIEHRAQWTIDYQIDPAIFSQTYSGDAHMISGSFNIETVWKEHVLKHDSTFEIALSGSLAGSIGESIVAQNSLTAKLSGIHTQTGLYIQLTDISLNQQANEVEQLTLWYALVKSYLDTWIYLSFEQYPQLRLFSPAPFEEIVSTHQKIRLIENPAGGRLRGIGDQIVSMSGSYLSESNHSIELSYPRYHLIGAVASTHINNIMDVAIQQENDYQGSFQGTLEYQQSRKSRETGVKGIAIWPGGIDINFVYTNIRKKSSNWSDIVLPKLYLERSTLLNNI